jgi:DNA-binding MarR family transcriptional regulator
MLDANPRLRRLNGAGLPLRLRELLMDGYPDGWLDRIDDQLYSSAMKQPEGTQVINRTGAAAEGATLARFLDVADVLYDRISEGLGRVGLSYAKYEVLKHLLDAQGPVTLGALAEGASCARSNITQIVDRLESEGLVRRVDDPDDRRSVRAELTPAGAAQAEEGTTQLDLVKAHFAASFTSAERVVLARLLAKLE